MQNWKGNEDKKMKGIELCADCAYYNLRAHKCMQGCDQEDNPYNPFYDDCPLPDVEPARKWVPCGERLPEESWEYLVYTDKGNIDVLFFSKKHQKWNAFDSTEALHAIEVSAWMPLPEPYEKAELERGDVWTEDGRW